MTLGGRGTSRNRLWPSLGTKSRVDSSGAPGQVQVAAAGPAPATWPPATATMGGAAYSGAPVAAVGASVQGSLLAQESTKHGIFYANSLAALTTSSPCPSLPCLFACRFMDKKLNSKYMSVPRGLSQYCV